MKAYVISLKERKDRRAKLYLPFDFELLLQERLTGVIGIDWSLGNLGCMLGHRQAIQLAKDNGLNEVLVLEDDAEMTGELPETMPYPITFLGGDFTADTLQSGDIYTNILGTHAVYYKNTVFDALLEQLPSLKELQTSNIPFMLEPYDIWLSKNGVGYVNAFKSFDETNSDISHGKKNKR